MDEGFQETEPIMTEVVMKLGGSLPSLTFEVVQKGIAKAYLRGLNVAQCANEVPAPTYGEFMDKVKSGNA